MQTPRLSPFILSKTLEGLAYARQTTTDASSVEALSSQCLHQQTLQHCRLQNCHSNYQGYFQTALPPMWLIAFKLQALLLKLPLPDVYLYMVPPWLVERMMYETMSNPYKLICIAIMFAAAFDTLLRGNMDYVNSAVDLVGNFVIWAWGVGAGHVEPSIYTLDLKPKPPLMNMKLIGRQFSFSQSLVFHPLQEFLGNPPLLPQQMHIFFTNNLWLVWTTKPRLPKLVMTFFKSNLT